MSKTLIILPESCRHDTALLQALESLRQLDISPESYFYLDGNELSLRKLLMESHFDTIVIGRPTLDNDFSFIQMARSLSIHSRLIVCYPDTSFIEKVHRMRVGNENGALAKWYAMGREIQCGIYRQGDLIIVATEDEKALLQKEVGQVPVVTTAELQGAEPWPFRERKKKVSIIMLTFNQKKMTEQCIASIDAHTPSGAFELIIVDNGSTDGSKEYLGELAAARQDVKIILNDKNLGFARANNQGAALATGEYVLLLNNDVILTEGWLERLLACAESDPSIGVAGPCTNNAVGQQLINISLELDDDKIQKYACMHLIKHAGNWFETHRIIGFCMLIKREVIERIGMLDERFGPGGFEDYDYCLRVKQAGYRIMIANDVFVYHIGGQGYSNNGLDYDVLRQQNVQIFIEKWCKRAMEVMESIS